MPDGLLLLLSPLGALAVNALTQALDYRLRGSLLGSYVVGYGAGLACLCGLSVLVGADLSAESLALGLVNLGIYSGFSMCFLAVVSLGISLRLRILSFLLSAGRPLTEAEIEARFEGHLLVRRRLDRLIAGGHVLKEGDRLVSAGTWLTSVALFNALVKRFLTRRVSEFH